MSKHKTSAADQVPLFEKISYGLGLASDHFATVSIMAFLMAFFTDFLNAGIKATVVGAAISVARLWDAFTDPAAGRLSDGCRAKWGRRRPFIMVGSLTMGLFFPVIWMVPETWSTTAINTWLFITVLVFYTLYSIFSVPYEALGAELTPDYRERTSIFVVRTYVQQVYTLFLYWMLPIAMALATLPEVEGEVGGIRRVSWFIGGVIIVAGLFPAFFCKERYQKIAEKEERKPFGETCKAFLNNKPLLIVIGTICFYLFSIMLSMNLAYFVNTYYVFGGDTLQGATLGAIDGTFRIVIAVVAAFAIKQLADRIDKHKLLISCVLILMVGFIGTYFTTLPNRPWLTLTFKPFISIGEVGFWVLVMSLRADVCDWDEYSTGSRNEGMIAAITNWVNKIAITLALALSGVMIDNVIKFDSHLDDDKMAAIEQQAETEWNALPENEQRVEEEKTYSSTWGVVKDIGGQILKFGAKEDVEGVTFDEYKKNLEQMEIMKKNDSGVMARLRVLYTLPQVVALIICFFILIKYPLNSKRMAEIRAELEERRGKTSD
jgi:GPH family glycoside/pentoside/hexuronide:cation symporter